jgi:hypothetical protein
MQSRELTHRNENIRKTLKDKQEKDGKYENKRKK